MTIVGTPTAEPAAPSTVRPDLLAYPAPTTVRFLVLLVALLGSGLFVGNWLHGEVSGREWVQLTLACETRAQEQTADLDGLQQLERKQRIANACRADAERERAGFALGGAAAVGLGGLIVLYVAPSVIERRRRLRPPGPRLEPMRERFEELAADTGLARTPLPVLGSSTQRDAFSYGAPGRYRVALPPAVAVRWRDQELFDPLLRHELAHVRHRDVTWAWLARSIWYVLHLSWYCQSWVEWFPATCP
jgi:Zn-dependent protease with chaperone function